MGHSFQWRVAAVTVASAMFACATTAPTPMEQAGAEFGKGMLQTLDRDAPKTVDALMKTAGEGLRQEVLTEDTNARLAAAIEALGRATREQLPGVREELIGRRSEERLERILVTLLATLEARGRRTAGGIVGEVGQGLREDVLDARTEARLNELLRSLGATTRVQTAQLRDDMLSPESDRAVRVIVASAMEEVVDASERIREKARAEISFLQKNAYTSLAMAAILGGIIAFVIWRQKEKNRILLNLLLAEVHSTASDKEREMYRHVEERAQQLGVAGPLRDAILKQRRAERAARKLPVDVER